MLRPFIVKVSVLGYFPYTVYTSIRRLLNLSVYAVNM